MGELRTHIHTLKQTAKKTLRYLIAKYAQLSSYSIPFDDRLELLIGPGLCIIKDDSPRGVPWHALPPGREGRAHVEAREWMCFGVEDDLVEREDVVVREEQVEIFKRFSLVQTY